MSFKHLQIRYQTARSLPAPYAYFYTLTAWPTANGSLDVNFSITYPDRDDIDDDELMAEGYTRHDDFGWAGRLPNAWQRDLTDLVDKTRLRPLIEDDIHEDDAFLELTIALPNGQQAQGMPRNNVDDWSYLVQELMQAAYEAGGREAAFMLHFLDIDNQNTLEINLIASFAERSIQVERIQKPNERQKTLPWSALSSIMEEVYHHDYPDEPLLKRPRQAGQWLNLGTDEWYNVSTFTSLMTMLRGL